MTRRNAWRETRIYAIGLIVAKSTGFLLLPLVTRFLPPEDYGRLELLSSLIAAGTLISSTWLVETLFRFAAAPEEEGRRAAADISGLTLVIAALLLGASLIAAPMIAPLLPVAASSTEVALAGAVIAAEAMNSVPLGWLRMQGRARAWALLLVGRTLLHLGLAALFLASGYGVAGVLAASVLASVALGLIVTAHQFRTGGGFRFAPRAWGPLIVYGAPLTLTGLATFALTSADLWFLAGHVSPSALGQYALAAKIALIAGLATQPFELWWYPRRLIVLREADGAARSARLAGFGAALGLLCAAGAAVLGPLLVIVLTPPAYHGGIGLLPWMAAIIAIQGLGSMVNVGCYIGRSAVMAMAVNLGGAATAILLYVLLIPRYGLAGAIMATLVAQTLRMIAFGVFSLRRAPIPYPFGVIALLAAACAVTAALPRLVGSGIAGPLVGCAGLAGALAFAYALGLTPRGRAVFAQRG